MKAKCYRLDYNELGLSTLCVEKDKEIQRLKEEYMMLQNASDKVEEKLQQRIDKAIEYIEKNSYTTIETIDDINYFIVRLDKCADLLDILKGVDEKC